MFLKNDSQSEYHLIHGKKKKKLFQPSAQTINGNVIHRSANHFLTFFFTTPSSLFCVNIYPKIFHRKLCYHFTRLKISQIFFHSSLIMDHWQSVGRPSPRLFFRGKKSSSGEELFFFELLTVDKKNSKSPVGY